jgi:hypothetical protein
MNQTPKFESLLTVEEKAILAGLTSPFLIQSFLDSVEYPSGEENRSVLNVLRKRQAHCLDGGLFAAVGLQRLGYPALLIDILPEPDKDDDHILAIYRMDGCWGAIAKSNFVGLRFREPVYRSLRELVMSYFESYFNIDGMKTMRGYTRPVHLKKYDSLNWLWEDHGVDIIEKELKKLKSIPLISPAMAERLNIADPLNYRAGLGVANKGGLYQPK